MSVVRFPSLSHECAPSILRSGELIPLSETSEVDSSRLGVPDEAYRRGPRLQSIYQQSPMLQTQFSPSSGWSTEESLQLAPPTPGWAIETDATSEQFLRSDMISVGRPTSPRRTQRALTLAAAFPAIAATVELLMLIYFLDIYLSLPRTESGIRRRISPFYSIWPYISCVGSIAETAFKAFSCIYTFFFIGTFVWDLWLNHDASSGYVFRWIRLAASVIAASILIGLVFASSDGTTHLHLYLTSVREIFAFTVKALTYTIDHLQRKKYPVMRRDSIMLISKRWKYVVLAGAIPAGIYASVGIYACQNVTEIQKKGTACYTLVAISSIADWTYELLNIAFNLSLAFDLYQSEYFAKLRASSPPRLGSMDSLLQK